MTVHHWGPSDEIAVLGSGNMGSGIAQAAAQAGFRVRVRDLTEEQLARGRTAIERTLAGAIQRGKLTEAQRAQVLGRIQFTTDLTTAVRGARLVIEAVFEEEAVKKALFEQVAPLITDDTIVVTNTSSLSVSRLSAMLPKPGRFAGLHFFYPAAINKLLEIVGGEATSPETLESLRDLAQHLKKIPIDVRDSAGFAVNRFFVPYMNEASRMAEEGLASLPTIEEVGRELTGSTNGPFEVMNLTGIPISLHSMESLETAFGPAYEPSELMEEKVRAKASWEWRTGQVEPERKAAVRERFEGVLYGIATRLVEEGVATPEAVETGAIVGLKWKRGPFALLSDAGLAPGLERVQRIRARWGESFPVSEELMRRVERGEKHWPIRYVRTERRGAVTWVLLDRPAVMNSLNSEVFRQLRTTFEELSHETHVRAVVLSGAGPVFCAGADIAEMAPKGITEGRAFGFLGQDACRAIERCPHPVIAFVDGYALGGGLELALSADFIVATDSAKVGLPEVSVGIHPGLGGLTRLARIVGRSRAKMLALSGLTYGADEAYRLGILAKVVPTSSGRSEVQALAETIASRAPLAVQWAKSVVDRAIDSSLESSVRLEGESAGHTFGTHDKSEGMAAFLEGRPPKFEGR